MIACWEEIHRLRANDFDARMQWKPSAVLDLFQSAAGVHADSLGVGYYDMLRRDLFWVLVRVRYEVVATPPLYSLVKIRTWPLAPGGLGGRRDYLVTDTEGSVLLRGASDWVFVSASTRKLTSARDIYPAGTVYSEERALTAHAAKVPDFAPDGAPFSVTPLYCEEDMNGHINNTRYADFALNALAPGENERVAALQLDYRKEVMPGETLSLFTRREEGRALVRGEGPEGQCRFACAVTWA